MHLQGVLPQMAGADKKDPESSLPDTPDGNVTKTHGIFVIQPSWSRKHGASLLKQNNNKNNFKKLEGDWTKVLSVTAGQSDSFLVMCDTVDSPSDTIPENNPKADSRFKITSITIPYQYLKNNNNV